MHEQPLEHIPVAAHVRAAETTGLVQMRTRPLQQFASLSEEAFLSVAADATSIRIDRITLRLCLLKIPYASPKTEYIG
jgi:hypothetical protein